MNMTGPVPVAGIPHETTSDTAALDARIARLTARQRDCLRLVAEGYTSKEIGRKLGISYSTVDNHLAAAVQLLELPGRAEAARRHAEHEREHGQKLTRQPKPLADAAGRMDVRSQVAASGPPSWLAALLPPIGGHQNDLPSSQRVYAIARIALFSTLAFVACVIVIRACFQTLG